MKCCAGCFKDRGARETVWNLAEDDDGLCDLCGQKSERLLAVEPESELAEQFRDMLSVFSLDDSCSQTLYDIFQETWDLFRHISVDAFSRFLETLFPGDERVGGLLRGGVRLDPSPDLDDRFALSFFGERDWNAFSEEVKHEHRYLAEISNKEVLSSLFNALEKIVEPEDGSWYRARIWNDKRLQDINEKELKEAPANKAAEGRMSPRGISCHYISDTPEGAMAEIRASRHDDVAVMEMKPVKPLRILDLSRIDEISPFDENVACGDLASNKGNLRQIKDALTKPMRSTDDKIEYVPTQYIAEFARLSEFDGIGYESVLYEKNGKPTYNIASFASFDEAFERCSLKLYRVSQSELTSMVRQEVS